MSIVESPKVWCNRQVLNDLRELAAQEKPLETGGCFAGYYPQESQDIVITDVIGPGSDAVHMRTRFVPDREFHDHALEKLWERSQHKIRYVGDWHTHPGGSSALSSIDKAFMRHALRSRAAYLKYALVAIVFGDLSDMRFWCLYRSSLKFGILSRFSGLDVINY